ncbi:conjugal transfer protein TraB [Streptomyces griseoviridis]|uniref:conjugal transfer protein TraB n=1 Tax=Streptomyces griseoviridis TaxID=45398 RepID=UPI0033C8B840
MSSNLAPSGASSVPVPADGDNRFKAVQAKLKTLAGALEDAGFELEALVRSVQANDHRTQDVARDIDTAGLDPKFVELTGNVSLALAGAAVQVNKLSQSAQETADLTHRTRRTHAQLYRTLDEIRSGRREKTPKPGFFNR